MTQRTLHHRHPRIAAGAGAGAYGRGRAGGGAWLADAEAWSSMPVRTSGDRIQDRPLAEVGGKALWTKELDLALLAGETDCSVHSMKDVESERPETLMIAAMLPRADVRDRLIGAGSIAELAAGRGGRHQLAAPRRAAQAASARPQDRLDPRQCRYPAGQAAKPARSTRPCSPRPGSTGWDAAMWALRSNSTRCCRPRRKARSGSNAAPMTS